MRYFFISLIILTAALRSTAQDTLYNGGFERWQGGVFSPVHGVGCCGIALNVPIDWGIPEQLMAMPTNWFTSKEIDTNYIHSGYYSARLTTATTIADSAGDVPGGRPVLIPGDITCAGIVGYGALGIQGDLTQTIAYSTGLPCADTPRGIQFYMYMEHDVPDTALFAYVFTRWDSVTMQEDTLASRLQDIPDAVVPNGRWVQQAYDIHYLLPGLPDTLHMIFYGGRNGDSTKAGNITWLDDVSFYLAGDSAAPAGIIHLSADDGVSVYPNPASSTLHVQIDEDMTGYSIALYDLTGSRVMQQVLTATQTSIDIRSLSCGVYLYRLLDSNAMARMSGKVTVSRE